MMLRITEIFCSLQGESTFTGLPTTFIRLTGCPLRCGYCDTAYAFQGGQRLSLESILDQVASNAVKHVCVTGGEPLAQPGCLALLSALCDQDYVVSLETCGALPLDQVDQRVHRVIDVKTPGSGEVERNHWQNLAHLLPHDQVKFVICHRADYDWANDCVRQYRLLDKCTVLYSPACPQQAPAELAQWIITDRAPIRFQHQLHKWLWGDRPGV